MHSIIFIIALLAIGMVLNLESKRAHRLMRPAAFPESTAQVLTSFVIYVSFPALVLQKIPDLVWSRAVLVPALLPWFALAVSAGLVLLAARLFRFDRPTTGALMLVVPLGNTSFFGIPMVEAFYGAEGVPYAVLYDQLGSFVGLATYGTIMLAIYSERESVSAGRIVRRIILFPPFIALVVALALRGIPYPAVLRTMIDGLAATLVPLVIIAVGFKIELRLDRRDVRPLVAGLAIRLVLTPLAALLLCRALRVEGRAVDVAIFEAGMPPMISAWALAMSAGLAPRLGAALVGLGILVSFVTLAGLYALL